MLLKRSLAVVAAVAAAFTSAPAQATPAVDQGAPDYYDSGLAKTPYMGWNTYYGLGAPSEASVKSVADFLVSSGLRDAGYRYVWIDGGWTAPDPRDAQGNLHEDRTKFPSGLSTLVTYLHGKGLKAGIYTDAGASDGKNCAAGSGGYYAQDTKRFASWKFDAVKVDFLCGIAQNLKPADAFTQFSKALAKAGRPMVLNVCNPVTDEWGVPHGPDQVAGIAYSYGPLVADSWRTSTDIAFGTPYQGIWTDVLRNLDANAAHPEANGPGHYNDPDYLIPMRKTEQGTYELNEEESTTQFVMWAEMASPLILGSDPRTLPASMISTLKNPEIVGVNQDRLGVQGVRVATTGTTDTYSKVLSRDGDRAVVLLNRGETPTRMTLNFADAGLESRVSVRDLRARADRGSATGSYTVTVPAHGTAFLRLHGTDLVPGDDLGGTASASPAIVRAGGKTVAFFRDQSGSLQVKGLDGPRQVGGEFLGQPAAVATATGIDVYVRGLDNALYQRSFTKKWGNWKRLGGTLTDSPSVTSDGAVFVRGADGQVWQRTSAGQWSGLGAPGGKPIYGRPGAATSTSGTVVAVRTADDSVWARTKTGDTWSDWTSIGGTVSSSPTLVAVGAKVALTASASDYSLWANEWSGSWAGWFKRPAYPSGSIVGTLGAASDGASLWFAARGPDDHVHVAKF